MDNHEKLKQLIADVFEVDISEVNDNTSQETLEMWDSIHQMNLVFSLEEVFEIQLSDEEVIHLQSFEQIKNVLQDKDILF